MNKGFFGNIQNLHIENQITTRATSLMNAHRKNIFSLTEGIEIDFKAMKAALRGIFGCLCLMGNFSLRHSNAINFLPVQINDRAIVRTDDPGQDSGNSHILNAEFPPKKSRGKFVSIIVAKADDG
ncbi:MAG TPA: hypothetical protein EYQ50_25250 [Verrucomicrobiales bacterium]|nr:hypothetical protein [Verrucomicrobiales bacterium]